MARPTGAPGSRTGAHFDDALACECVEEGVYRSSTTLWQPVGGRGTYGGQVIAQAVAVSCQSAGAGWGLRSFHCCFIMPAAVTQPIYYHARRLYDADGALTNRVEARQDGRLLFLLLSSHSSHVELDVGQCPTDGVYAALVRSRAMTPYEEAALNEVRYQTVLTRQGDALPPGQAAHLRNLIRDREESPIELRDALPRMYGEDSLPLPGREQAFWIRSRCAIAGGPPGQQAALAYASDLIVLSTIPKVLGIEGRLRVIASLDHSVWFHDAFDLAQPLLFFVQAQVSAHGRGLTMGKIFRRDGVLVASLAQEGVVRGLESTL